MLVARQSLGPRGSIKVVLKAETYFGVIPIPYFFFFFCWQFECNHLAYCNGYVFSLPLGWVRGAGLGALGGFDRD